MKLKTCLEPFCLQTINNMPSWTDRVLWKTFPDMYIANTAYGKNIFLLVLDFFHPLQRVPKVLRHLIEY